MIEEVTAQVERVLRISLKLGEDIVLRPDSNLVDEIGLDSLEAFEAIALLHELLGVRIPDDMNPQSFATVGRIATCLVERYDPAVVQAFARADIAARLAEMNSTSELG